jgi:hypothetical protein
MNGRWIERDRLSLRQRNQMLSLMQAHFDGITPAQFVADLAGKDGAVLLEDETGRVYDSAVAPVRVAYSGDTIVEHAARNSPVLARTWIATAQQLGAEYWLLITSGFRTYRFLSVFWREFWPRYDAPQPPPLLEALAREQFGHRYADGIVRFPQPQCLHGATAEIPAGRHSDPHIAFFAQCNPGWARGDELVCLCELAEANLTPAGERMVGTHDGVAA